MALVPGPAEDFRFSKPPVAERERAGKRVEQRKAGATVTLDRVRKNNAAWEISLRVKFDSPSTALESHRGWILDNDAYFVDATGRRILPGGFEQSRQAGTKSASTTISTSTNVQTCWILCTARRSRSWK